MLCIKEETCVRNKGSKWANILKTYTYLLPLSPFCTLTDGQAWSCSRTVTPEQATRHHPKRGAWSKVGMFFPPWAVSCGWSMFWYFHWSRAQAGTSRWNSSGKARDDPGWVLKGVNVASGSEGVLIASGMDREAWVNDVHPLCWSPSGHSVCACTVIRCGSLLTVGTGISAWFTQLSLENTQVAHWQEPSHCYWPIPITWAGVSGCCGCLCCPAVMPGLKNEGLSGSLTPPGPAPSFLSLPRKIKYIPHTKSLKRGGNSKSILSTCCFS